MNRRRILFKTGPHSIGFRSGFTLVELLISVALTVLIMTMFVQVFQLASASIRRQKGIANLDQSERTLTTILLGDISRRTFLDVVPFKPGQSTTGPPTPGPLYKPGKRRGYFSISENDPDNNTDDVLQFTIETSNSENQPLFGRAAFLRPSVAPATDYNTVNKREAYLHANRNQPAFDDGRIGETINPLTTPPARVPMDDGIGSSSAAEVSYFLRNGILYRRVLLIRETYDPPASSAQPTETNGQDYGSNSTYIPPGNFPTGDFWNDFDYSAFHRGGSSPGLWFHNVGESLTNEILPPGGIDPTFGFPISLGVPHLRFGHSPNRIGGTPREFVGPEFIGRFTAQETAHSDFGYPGRIPAVGDPVVGDPFVGTTPPLTFNDQTGLVNQFSNQKSRRGDDILLTNVHEFNVKVWDDHTQVQAFVDLGNGSGLGYYNATNNTAYGNRYDTWHPWTGMTAALLGPAPYRPVDLAKGLDELGSAAQLPLKAIQITIRFFDTTSNRMRQMTLVLSLVD